MSENCCEEHHLEQDNACADDNKPQGKIKSCKDCGKDFMQDARQRGRCNDCEKRARAEKRRNEAGEKQYTEYQPRDRDYRKNGGCEERLCKICGKMFLPNIDLLSWVCNDCQNEKRRLKRKNKLETEGKVVRRNAKALTYNERDCKTCDNPFMPKPGRSRQECDDCLAEKQRQRNKNMTREERNILNARQREYANKRKKNDPEYKFKNDFSKLFYQKLKSFNIKKSGKSTYDILPYSVAELMANIEGQFEEWMTWENHGKYNVFTWDDNDQTTWTWNIDHIQPHASFHYTSFDDQDFQDCWALSNLRPYSAKQNIIDNDRGVRSNNKKVA